MTTKKTVFFVPVYNQINEFPDVLKEFKESNLPCNEILLVNNGSNDGSEKLVRESGFPFIDLQKNFGVGYAYISAIDWALNNGYDILGTIAANGKMLPSEMNTILSPVINGEADYVTGSRFLKGERSPNLPNFRRRSIPWVNRYAYWLTGAHLTDATCGYRAWNLDIIRKANFDWHQNWLHTYSFEYYLYAKIILDGRFRWIEAPITMKYPPKGQKYSKIPPVTGWFAMLRPWMVARLDGQGFLK